MKILLVVANFIPEIGSAAHIYYDLAKEFLKKGHDVDIITSYPREFNLNKEDQNKEYPLIDDIGGITVYRCKHPVLRDNIIIRGLEHFYVPYIYFNKFKSINKKYDVCLMYIPPLPLYYLAKKIKNHDGTPSILNFQDFHPQELTDVGVLRNPLMIKLLEYIESKAYVNADHITVLSKGGIKYIQERGANLNAVTHIYNSICLDDFNDMIQKSYFKNMYKIKDKFLISYAGILSPYQGIDTILNTARLLKDHDDIVFLIAGEGSEKQRIEERIKDEGISNVRLLSLLPRPDYFNLINSSDVSLISLDERMKAPCLPGKTVNLMACSQPIVAMVAGESETADVVRKAECGIVVKPGDIAGIRSAILYLKEDASVRESMGSNGRRYLENNMTLEKNVGLYEEIFSALSGDGVLAGRSSSSRSSRGEDPSGVEGL